MVLICKLRERVEKKEDPTDHLFHPETELFKPTGSKLHLFS